jgi:hypothetical protein
MFTLDGLFKARSYQIEAWFMAKKQRSRELLRVIFSTRLRASSSVTQLVLSNLATLISNEY